jgi:hypothetical protein
MFVVNRASIVLAQQQLLLKMEHALTPVLKKIFKPLMLIYLCYLPNPFKKATKMRSFLTESLISDNSAAAAAAAARDTE